MDNLVPVFHFALRDDLEGDSDFLPTKAHSTDSGWDVCAAQVNRNEIVLRPGQYFKIPLGFKSFCPEGWYYMLYPRSSSFTKKTMHNLIGIIDETYEGEAVFAGQYLPGIHSLATDLVISFKEKIGQIIPHHRQEMIVESITNEKYKSLCEVRGGKRSDGGFGSTSK